MSLVCNISNEPDKQSPEALAICRGFFLNKKGSQLLYYITTTHKFVTEMRKLRDYQSEGHAAVFAALDRGVTNQLFVLATGMGKTFTASQIMDRFKRTLWITHAEELINQSALSIMRDRGLELEKHRNILHFLDDKETQGVFASDEFRTIRAEMGVIKQHRFDVSARVVVASVQTLVRRLHKIDPRQFDCVIADEAHLSCSPTWTKVLHHFKPRLRLGLTATPRRADGISLANHFDEIVFERDIKFAVDNGYLVELDAVRIKTEIDIDKIRTTGGDMNQADMEALLDTPARNNLIADSFLKYSPNARALGFCIDMQHAINLCRTFNEKGIKADFVVADTELCPDREERILRFKRAETQVLFNVMILTMGFDVPAVDCIIMARPTKSLTLYLQAIGRGTRPLSGVIDGHDNPQDRIAAIGASLKPKCMIMDIVDATNRHSLINSWTLDKGKDPKDKVFITRAKRADLEKQRLNRAMDFTRTQDERVNLMAIPKWSVNNSHKMQEAATEKQLELLKRKGLWQEGVEYTKRDCSEVYMMSPASEAQIWRLAKEGYDVSKGITIGDAEAAFKEINEREQRRALTQDRSAILGKSPIKGIR